MVMRASGGAWMATPIRIEGLFLFFGEEEEPWI